MNIKILPKYREFLFKTAFLFFLGLIIYISFNTILKWFLPFILAYIIAYITNPLVNFLEVKLKLKRKLASGITILFTISAIISLLFFIIYRIVFEIKRLSERLPSIYDKFSNSINIAFSKGMNMYNSLPREVTQFTDNIKEDMAKNLTSILKSLTESTTRFAYNFATKLPSVLIFIVVLFLSTYFISSDRKKISKFIGNQVPKNAVSRIRIVKNDLFSALIGYIKAQLILMSITFIEITIAMIIIGVDYALLIALLISFIDALPILGTGIVLLPWSLLSLISGDFTLALYLVILYGIILLVRQILEPKILGSQIGLYPLITLMSMYVGLKVFGILGMILGPIVVLVIKSINGINLFNLWKD